MRQFFMAVGLVLLMMTWSGAAEYRSAPGDGPEINRLPGGEAFAQRKREGDLEFVKAEAFLSKDKKKYHIKGAVLNVNSKTTVRDVRVTVRVYDQKDTLLYEETVPASPDKLGPGEEGTFEVVADFNENFHRVNRSATWKTSRW